MKSLVCTSLAILLSLGSSLLAAPSPDPQMQAVLDKLASLGGKPIETLSAEEARKQPSPADAVKAIMKDQDKKPPEVGDVDNTSVKVNDASIKIRVYQPKGDGPFPVIFYIHGGGWVIADLDTYDSTPRGLCHDMDAVVISTHYRQAPENKFPTAHLDVFGVYQWVLENAGKYKADTKKLAVVGESAGATMACAVSMMAKEKGIQLPVYQGLIYPVSDVTDMNTPSYQENADAKPLNKPMMEWFGKQTLAKQEDGKNPRLSLALAGDELKGLPPSTIITAQIDPLRTDGEKLAKALERAGVKVHLQNFDGVTHEFFGMGAVVDKAKEANQLLEADLKVAFGM